MTSRGPVGASNRPELFASARKHNESARAAVEIAEEKADNSTNSVLQLEHILGFSGDNKGTLITCPFDENIFVRSLGSLVSIENLMDPHSQRLLRGHDMPVSALAMSPSGSLIASGQIGTKNFKGNAAPIFIWQYVDGRRYTALKGLSNKVNLLAFSTDERFLCASGEDCLLYVWDLDTSEVVYCQRLPSPASVLKWVEHKKVGQYMSYELVIGVGNILYKCPFTYEPMRVQWVMKMVPYTMPSGGGIIRNFTSVDISSDFNFIYVGSTGGEVMVFRRDTAVFRACVPICSNGVQGVVSLANGDVVCAGGDGFLRRIRGGDMAWQMAHEAPLQSPVRAIALSCNGSELLVSCASGTLFRCLAMNFNKSVVTVGHTSCISCVSFNYDERYPSSLFATGTVAGEVRVWDISDYACITVQRFPQFGATLCLSILKNDSLISGWEDGFIRCHDLSTLNRQLWYIPNAHRGGVRSISYHLGDSLQYLVTGGNDSVVRVWKLSNRELVTEHSEHGKGVVKVSVDVRAANIIHSAGGNGTVVSFDLKACKRIISHMISNGCSLLDMTQRLDNELELITCDNLGRLLYWDIDYRDPTSAVQDPSRTPVRACVVSPSGKYLAFVGDDMLLKVMSMVSGEIVALGQGHSDVVRCLIWTPDERQVISGGDDSCLCIWNFYLAGQ